MKNLIDCKVCVCTLFVKDYLLSLNLFSVYLTKFLTKMINWTWQDMFDVMTMFLGTKCCCTALYLAVPHIIKIIKRFIRMLIRKWR